MEKDEVYVPKTRNDLGIPEEDGHTVIDYEDYFGDTPIFTLFMLVRQQHLAFPAYLREFFFIDLISYLTVHYQCLVFNVSGQKNYPPWTNHFDRMSFKLDE